MAFPHFRTPLSNASASTLVYVYTASIEIEIQPAAACLYF
jgi:hypothetical protein